MNPYPVEASPVAREKSLTHLMQRIPLTGRVQYLDGLVGIERGLLVIDTGLDRSAANKVIRVAEEMGRR